MSEAQDYRPEDVQRYPLNMVVAIIAPEDATSVISALTTSGIASDQLDVASGANDGQRIEDATERGLLGRLTGALAPTEEVTQRQAYVEALRTGAAVIRVHLPDATQKAAVGELLAAHGGHFINYYGRWTVESLMP